MRSCISHKQFRTFQTLMQQSPAQRMEHYLSINPIFMEMLGKVYRELMLLGFISLSLILAKEFEMVCCLQLLSQSLAST